MISKVEGQWFNKDWTEVKESDWVELDKNHLPELFEEESFVKAMEDDKKALGFVGYDEKITYLYRVTRGEEVTVYNVREVD